MFEIRHFETKMNKQKNEYIRLRIDNTKSVFKYEIMKNQEKGKNKG